MANLAADTFVEASDVQLDAHTADTGESWTIVAATAGGATVVAATDLLNPTGSIKPSFKLNDNPASADYKTKVGTIWDGTVNRGASCACRWNGTDPTAASGADAYLVQLNDTGLNNLRKVVNSVETTLETGTVSAPVSGTEHDVQVEAEGTTIRGFWKGVQIGASNTDTAISSAGNPGIGSGFGDSRRNDGYDYDNVSVDDFAADGWGHLLAATRNRLIHVPR